ncbi:unnamed protein product [Clavelina lepadiformis]|uniref:Uncharacterized protein n=1 Tax=Clavelina lepadiformis TaxID=159417 RepID=A0ABP0GY53_CLALP
MSSKTRIQSYLKRNKVSELFEEMMSKLVQDLPANPVEYLFNLLQEKYSENKKISSHQKTAVPITRSLAQTSPNANRWSDAGSKIEIERLSRTADLSLVDTDGQNDSNRQYAKPWLNNSKKSSYLRETKHGSPTKLESSMRKTATSPKPCNDKMADEDLSDVDLRLIYASPKVCGKEINVMHDDSELPPVDFKGNLQDKSTNEYFRGPSSEAAAKLKRQKELRQMVLEAERKPKLANKVKVDDETDDDDDDAIELSEDWSDLQDEGVKNPPKTGIHVSKLRTQKKEEIELILNMSKFFDSLGGAVSVTDLDGKPKSQVITDLDDDFESASQVTGPRHPVWDAPESEVDSAVSPTKKNISRRMKASMFDLKSEVSNSGSQKTKK